MSAPASDVGDWLDARRIEVKEVSITARVRSSGPAVTVGTSIAERRAIVKPAKEKLRNGGTRTCVIIEYAATLGEVTL